MFLQAAQLLLIFSVFIIFYIYAGYPLLAYLLARFFPKTVQKSNEHLPSVTILIAAYNEEVCIAQTINNKLEQNYPEDKLEIIVISDESTDKTDEIVKSFSGHRVKFLRQSPRAGKTAALNLAAPMAKGEILVFSDANSLYTPDALRHLVANFHDPSVGYVTGRMVYLTTNDSSVGEGCSTYMKYENKLRSIETVLGSLVGVDGGIDAMRKSIYSPLSADQLPDFVQPLKVIEKGYRVVYEPSAILREEALNDSSSEYRMRVRVTLRALWAIKDMTSLLFGKGGMLFAWQLWSHKVLRYQCFIFLILAFLCNLALLKVAPGYVVFFIAQIICYIGALSYWIFSYYGIQIKSTRLIYFFVLLNTASLHATIKFLMGKKQVTWVPRKG